MERGKPLRSEKAWEGFSFKQPYEKGLKKLREVLANPDYDPATLWQWGTMQAMALVEVLKACERKFGREGQKTVGDAIKRVGYDIGKQILEGLELNDSLSEAEFISFFATIINRIVYASLEEPKIDSDTRVSFHIIWCPHQDHYSAFDCRIQRYLVQGMMDAMREKTGRDDWQVRFTTTIPSGGETCHFVIWKTDNPEEKQAWEKFTEEIERRALQMSMSGDGCLTDTPPLKKRP